MKRLIVILVIIFTATSCGYRVGRDISTWPPELRKVSIPLFENGSDEPGIEVNFTQATIDEFRLTKGISIVPREDAQLIIKGQMTYYHVSPSSFTSSYGVLQNKVSVALNLRIIKKSDGKVLWESSYSGSEPFDLSSDILITKAKEAEAAAKLARAMMRGANRDILESF